MNRNVLKIIAVISMIIDHIGLFLLDNNIICRSIGRLAFPLFAFFISEGMRYTRSKKRYVLNLSIFAVVSQIPFSLLLNWYNLNILFTFLIAIAFIVLIEEYKKETKMPPIFKNLLITISIVLLFAFSLLGEILEFIDYGLIGVALVVCFYFVKSKLRLLAGSFIILLFTVKAVLINGFCLINFYRLFALGSIVLLLFYNGQKGKVNLKYLFYSFYPIDLLLHWIITLF